MSLLGVPVDENFRPLEGVGSLVPEQFVDEPAKTNRFSSDWGEIETEAELRASFNAWFVSGGGGVHSMGRTMTLDNLYVRETHQFVPAYRMQAPPAASHYVITAIEVGHLAQFRFRRENSGLSAHVAAEIKQLGAKVDVLQRELGVDATIYALGVGADTGKGPLKPLAENEFAREFSANEPDAVPVRVRYTPVRGRELRDGVLEWAKSYVIHIAPGTLVAADDGTWFATLWELSLSCLRNKVPLRRHDYRTWEDANPKRDAKGRAIPADDGNATDIDLYVGSFDGKKTRDLIEKWVEFPAEAGDRVQCSLTLRTKDNPADSLGKPRSWPVFSTQLGDGTAASEGKTVQGTGKYRFTLPFTVEFRGE